MARQALELLTGTLPQVARDAGVSLETLRSYRTNRRVPSPKTAAALATLMRTRAKSLVTLADKLDALTTSTTHKEN